MISSKQLVISGGQFTQQHYHGQKAPIDKLTDAISPNAFHDSAARFDPPKCHPRTRVKILDDIMGRILGQGELDTAAKPFLWLNGAAGAGKSAIAQSTIERCIERGLPLASFFFSKSDATRNYAKPLVATLAYQLYQAFPGTEVQAEIISAIIKEPLIFTKQIQQQFTALVVQPLKAYLSRHQLSETQTSASFLIVIDGLDECVEHASQKAILSGLADSVRDSNPYIRIFIASRPEYDITQSFGAKHLKDVHTRLSLDLDKGSDVESDIKLYLSDQLEQIKDGCNNDSGFWPKLAESWPGEGVIRVLAWKSSGQFIYAATVIRYVTSARPIRPDRSLDMVLEVRPHDGDHPFAELDALYEKILESCKNIDKVLEVLSLRMMDIYATVEVSISVALSENVLSYETGEIGRLFCDLGALVTVRIPIWSTDPRNMHLIILHASFIDYLRDEARSKQFYIDLQGKYFSRHMVNLLNYLASCGSDFDPLDASSLGLLAADLFIPNTVNLESCIIPPELLQAAFSFPLEKFLAPHISLSDVPRYALDFVVAFLDMLQIMALEDPTHSYIEDHQHRNLDSVMIRPLQRYFDDDRLALVLVIFCRLGSHRFFPWCDTFRGCEWPFVDARQVGSDVLPNSTFTSIFLNKEEFGDDEKLRLCYLWCHGNRSRREADGFFIEASDRLPYLAYVDYMQRLLRSVPAPTPTLYAKAAKECFDALPLLPMPSFFWKRDARVVDDTEDDPCPYLVFNDKLSVGPWLFVESKKWSDSVPSYEDTVAMEDYEDEQWDMDDEAEAPWELRGDAELSDYEREFVGKAYFTILGYLIFFLPRCGRSDDLIAACKRQQVLCMEKPKNPFPIRWRRLHMEINNYLARV
ncbi:hypothetical protein D9613_012019 [Agrocybe pediades]|uniref:Nephrocystin 3-like N-terminal domain-containing protein n=1 Tax=Agrocybe pediades TaxID=84607 RepID=A0A8H4VHD5_9AGAR|nr:hypothetical protein D9613_012019 [Agrocybe pediades]